MHLAQKHVQGLKAVVENADHVNQHDPVHHTVISPDPPVDLTPARNETKQAAAAVAASEAQVALLSARAPATARTLLAEKEVLFILFRLCVTTSDTGRASCSRHTGLPTSKLKSGWCQSKTTKCES